MPKSAPAAIALILLLVAALPALAQHQSYRCDTCRAVQAYPKDFGNFAYNLLIEPLDDNFSRFSTYSASTYVWNLQGQYALVILEDVLEDTGASASVLGFNFPIQISGDYVQITVQDQYGTITRYQVIETSRPLVVGGGSQPPPERPAPHPATEGGGETTNLCCQEGTYYWHYDRLGLNYATSH